MRTWIYRNIFHPLCRWYEGKDVRINPEEPETIGGLGVLHETRKEFHWSAKIARKVISFYPKYWQWIWGIAIALIVKFL